MGDAKDRRNRRARLGLALGGVSFGLLLLAPPPAEMSEAAWRVAGVAMLMAIWWVTEPLPIAATALLPLVLFPMLGVADIGAAAAPYADPVIFLFFGGLVLGLALQRWDLHRRIALRILGAVGEKPPNLILGFMAATAFISMWVSNTAAAAMMLPVAVSVVALHVAKPFDMAAASPADRNFALAMLLGVAFAASIGGMATLIGTPPNALFAGFLRRTYGIEIGFAHWMAIAFPVAALLLLGTWIILTRVAFPLSRETPEGIRERLLEQRVSVGAMTTAEWRVGLLFLGAGVCWIVRPVLADWVPGIDDTVIAVALALALFVIPSGRGGTLMDWNAVSELPWGVLLLFGGGLSLAAAIVSSGLAAWIGAQLTLFGTFPLIALVLVLVLVTIALSELASNTAVTAAFLPLVAAIADGLGMTPSSLTLPLVLAASCGFMLPVATPPNALAYASGYVRVTQMARAGAFIDLLGAALVVCAAYVLYRTGSLP